MYQDLIELSKALDDNKQQQINRRSSLIGRTGFLPHLGLTADSSIGQELFDQTSIDEWLRGKAPSTARASQTHLRWWQTIYTQLLRAQELPDEPKLRIQAAIQQGIQRLGINQEQLAKRAGMHSGMISEWAAGNKLPSDRIRVGQLEKALELLPGTLTNYLNWERRGESFCSRERLPQELRGSSQKARALRSKLRWSLPAAFPTLDFREQERLIGEHSARLLNDPIYVHNSRARTHTYGFRLQKAPERLRAEIDAFFKYKTAPVLPPHQRRAQRGRIRREASRKGWEDTFEFFFGWYLLPTEEQHHELYGHLPDSQMRLGAGGSVKELTLGLFAVPALVEAYLVWRTTVRSSGPNSGTIGLIQKLKSLVQPDTGYLTQHPELIERVPERYRRVYYQAHAKFLRAAAEEQSALTRALQEADARVGLRRGL